MERRYYQIDHKSFFAEQCCNCAAWFLMPAHVYENARKNPGNGGYHFHCPAGHPQHYGSDSEADKQRRRAERAEQKQAELLDEIAIQKRKTAAAKAQLTRHKKRSAAGTCPCCKRTFQNMARHMKNQHPEFIEDQGGKVVPIKRKKSA